MYTTMGSFFSRKVPAPAPAPAHAPAPAPAPTLITEIPVLATPVTPALPTKITFTPETGAEVKKYISELEAIKD